MDDNLDQLLHNLKLHKLRQILPDEIKKAMKAKASYEDLLVSLFRAQYQDQIERSIQSRIRHARVPEKWSLATFPFDRQPGVEARVIRQLGTLDFVGRAENLVLVGPPGVGKTGIATGLLLRALESGYRGRFLRAQDLFDELYASLADRSTRKLLDSLARVDVLLVDEMGYLNLRPEQSNAFFKLMEERYVAKHTTLITTNLAYDAWYEFLGNKKMVEALLDRLRQRCHTITIEGPSLRTPAAAAAP
jgi:DNA replication protein DnaC